MHHESNFLKKFSENAATTISKNASLSLFPQKEIEIEIEIEIELNSSSEQRKRKRNMELRTPSSTPLPSSVSTPSNFNASFSLIVPILGGILHSAIHIAFAERSSKMEEKNLRLSEL